MPDGSRNLELEHGLAQLESDFTIIRKKLEDHALIDARDVVALLSFMVAMTYRSKQHRDFQRRQWSRVFYLADSVRRQFADGRPAPPFGHSGEDGTPVDFEALEDLKERPVQKLLPMQMEITLPLFMTMDIAVVDVPESPGLITCDDPCVWVDPEAYRRPPVARNVSLVDNNVEVSLPISPHQIILLNRKGVSGYSTTSNRTVEEFNRRAVSNAGEEVIANTNQKLAAWFEFPPLPEDAWENTPRARELAERRKKWTPTS